MLNFSIPITSTHRPSTSYMCVYGECVRLCAMCLYVYFESAVAWGKLLWYFVWHILAGFVPENLKQKTPLSTFNHKTHIFRLGLQVYINFFQIQFNNFYLLLDFFARKRIFLINEKLKIQKKKKKHYTPPTIPTTAKMKNKK